MNLHKFIKMITLIIGNAILTSPSTMTFEVKECVSFIVKGHCQIQIGLKTTSIISNCNEEMSFYIIGPANVIINPIPIPDNVVLHSDHVSSSSSSSSSSSGGKETPDNVIDSSAGGKEIPYDIQKDLKMYFSKTPTSQEYADLIAMRNRVALKTIQILNAETKINKQFILGRKVQFISDFSPVISAGLDRQTKMELKLPELTTPDTIDENLRLAFIVQDNPPDLTIHPKIEIDPEDAFDLGKDWQFLLDTDRVTYPITRLLTYNKEKIQYCAQVLRERS